MSAADFFQWVEDFFGQGVFSTTAADNAAMLIADTSAAGTPTYQYVDGSASGEVAIDFSNNVEVQNVCLYQGDQLQFDIDKVTEVEFDVKLNQATLDAASQLAFGLISDRNDDIDTIAQAALFKVTGGATAPVVVETDDGVLDNDDVATGAVLANAYKRFKISFATGKADVRFFVDGQPVAEATKFDMSNYSGSLQAFVQLQKTADANTDGVTIDRISVRGRR